MDPSGWGRCVPEVPRYHGNSTGAKGHGAAPPQVMDYPEAAAFCAAFVHQGWRRSLSIYKGRKRCYTL